MSASNAALNKLSSFGNKLSKAIITIIISMFVMGLLLMTAKGINKWSVAGLVMTCLAIVWWFKGMSDFVFPKAGVLTFWGKPVEVQGKTCVVTGKTVLADFFPLYIGVIDVDMSIVDIDFPVPKAQTKNKAIMSGKASLSLYPIPEDMIDFLRAGGTVEGLKSQFDDIVLRVVRDEAKNLESDEIMTNSHIIADAVRKAVEANDFGVGVFKCQVILNLPEDVEKAQNAVVVEASERKSEAADYATNLREAVALQEAYRNDPLMTAGTGKVPTLRECLDEVLRMRLVKYGKVTEVKGGIGVLNVK